MLQRIRIKGATIVSMDPKIGIIDSGDLLIDGGKIVAVGRNLGSWAVIEIDGRGMIAMPGFVNGHIHLWQTALRGIAADWTLDHYFGVLIGKVVGLYTPQDAYIGNLVGALDQINSGVTTLFDWCHIVNTPAHADAAVDALREAGIRAIFAYGTPMTLFGTKEPHPADARRMRHERLSSSEALVTMALAIRGTDFAPGTAEADISFARDLGVIASFHVACAKHGPRPQSMQSLAQQGLLGKDKLGFSRDPWASRNLYASRAMLSSPGRRSTRSKFPILPRSQGNVPAHRGRRSDLAPTAPGCCDSASPASSRYAVS